MAHLSRPGFPHRLNPDGSYDSICTVCLATVATVRKEEQLYPSELAHLCDPLRLYQVSQVSTPLAVRTKRAASSCSSDPD